MRKIIHFFIFENFYLIIKYREPYTYDAIETRRVPPPWIPNV